MIVTIALAALFNLAAPFVLAGWFFRRTGVTWKLVGVGVLTFVASQVVYLPLLYGLNALLRSGWMPLSPIKWQLLFNSAAVGLLAGLCIETARLVGLKALKERALSWKAGLAVGIGHSGAETVLLVGLGQALTLTMMIMLTQNPLLFGPLIDPTGALTSQLSKYWSAPWDLPLTTIVERSAVMVTQVMLTLVVWLAVARRNLWFYWAAVAWHAILDTLLVGIIPVLGWGNWAVQGCLALAALLNAGIMWRVLVAVTGRPAPTVQDPVALG